MTRQTQTTQRRGRAGDTRAKILQSALRLFAEQGYERTTFRQIADEIGIKDPSLYKHFAGKDALYSSVMEYALQPLVDEVASWSKQDLYFSGLLKTPRAVVQLLAQHPHGARLLQRELNSSGAGISPMAELWFGRLLEAGGELASKAGLEGGSLAGESMLPLLAMMNVALGYFSCAPLMASLGAGDPLGDEMLDAQSEVLGRIFKAFLMEMRA